MRFPFLLTITIGLYFVLGSSVVVNKGAVIKVSSEEQKLHQLINRLRKNKGLHEVPLSPALCKVAQVHAKDLSEYHQHGKSCNMHSWSKNGKWEACCYTADHRNAACMWYKPRELAGYDSEGYEIAHYETPKGSPESAVKSWEKSSGHLNTILNRSSFKKIRWEAMGVAIYGNYTLTWFGSLKDSSSLIIQFE
jgi:hypothetical protein